METPFNSLLRAPNQSIEETGYAWYVGNTRLINLSGRLLYCTHWSYSFLGRCNDAIRSKSFHI